MAYLRLSVITKKTALSFGTELLNQFGKLEFSLRFEKLFNNVFN